MVPNFIKNQLNFFRKSKKIPGEKFTEKTSQVGTSIAYHTVGQPVWTPRAYDTLAYEGFQKNPIVYRCVSLTARSAASVPWKLYKGEEEVEDHPLLSLLKAPSPRQGRASFIEAVVAYLLLSGNSYVEALSLSGQEPTELYPLRPDRMKVIPSHNGDIAGYVYSVNGQEYSLNGEHILHLKHFHPLNDWYGMSPMEAIAGAIDQHNAVSAHNLSLLQNGARPSGALILRHGQHHPYLTQQQRKEFASLIQDGLVGESNSGCVVLIEGDYTWQELGMRLKDLDFIEGKKLSAREISQAYGVPPMLVGVSGDSTYANYREARFHFWEDTVLPVVDMVIEAFNQWLAPRFDPNLRFVCAIDTIPALAPRREMTWDKIVNADFLTLNEKRRAVGYGPLEGKE
jgi:HK97 family phage portal protein